jgi:hypothetical protein
MKQFLLKRMVLMVLLLLIGSPISTLSGCGIFKTRDMTGTTTVCPVHDQPLREESIRISYGTPFYWEECEAARRELFPFANSDVCGGCISTESSPWWARVRYCQVCREVQNTWLEQYEPQYER